LKNFKRRVPASWKLKGRIKVGERVADRKVHEIPSIELRVRDFMDIICGIDIARRLNPVRYSVKWNGVVRNSNRSTKLRKPDRLQRGI